MTLSANANLVVLVPYLINAYELVPADRPGRAPVIVGGTRE